MANYKYKNDIQRRKAIARSNKEYKKRAQKAFSLRFHKVYDEAVITKFKSVPNITDYVRKLVLKDIEKEGE